VKEPLISLNIITIIIDYLSQYHLQTQSLLIWVLKNIKPLN